LSEDRYKVSWSRGHALQTMTLSTLEGAQAAYLNVLASPHPTTYAELVDLQTGRQLATYFPDEVADG
jgi:hypothetical protein